MFGNKSKSVDLFPFFSYNKKDYYMTYQPTGIKDWSIVGIVEGKAQCHGSIS